jgi:hypothetical protein
MDNLCCCFVFLGRITIGYERRMSETAGEEMYRTEVCGTALVEKIVPQGRQHWRGEEEVALERMMLGTVGMTVFLLEIAAERGTHRCCQE